MPVDVSTGSPLGPIAEQVDSVTVTGTPPTPPVPATRPIFGSSQKDGVTGFERLEDLIVGRPLEARRVFWPTMADDPRGPLTSDKAAGRIPVCSMKPPASIMDLAESARPAIFNTHRANVIALDTFQIWTVNHEPENDGYTPAEYRARYMAYWRCMKGLNVAGDQVAEPVANVMIGPVFMAATDRTANRQGWRDLLEPALDPLPMDILMCDGYNSLNRVSFANIFSWWGDKAVALDVPWLVAETSTHGTPLQRESWVAGMDTYSRKPDAASQALKGILWFDDDRGPNAGSVGWRMEDAFEDGWTIVNNLATGTRREDTLTPARVRLFMDSYPARTLQEPGTVPVPDLDAGPVSIGTATYPFPVDAVFVALGAPDTNLGTEASPVGTLTRAAALAPNPGVIVYRAGVYTNVSDVNLPNKALTIQNYPGEAVWWEGSDLITSWNIDPANGARWRRTGWSTVFSRSLPDTDLVTEDNPAAAWAEQIWKNDLPLEQANTLAAVTDTVTEVGAPGRFFFDTATKILYISTSPFSQTMRITTRQVACTEHQTGKPGLHLRGFGIRRYGTSQDQYAAVRQFGAGGTWENMHVVECSSSALFAQSTERISVQHCLFDGLGQMAVRLYRVTFADAGYNIVRRCNRKRFATYGAAGGFKWDTECHGGIMHHNFAELNYGHSFWFDLYSHYTSLIGNVIDGQSQAGAGVFAEMSAGQTVAGNWVRGCTHGVLVSEPGPTILVANNTTVDCTNHVRVQRGARDLDSASGFRVTNHLASDSQATPGVLVAFHDTNGNTRDYIESDWHITDTRAWRKTPGATPYAQVTMPGNTLTNFATQAALAAATGEEGGSVYSDSVVTDPYLETDRKTPKATCVGTGTPIPVNVADMLGWNSAQRATPNIGAY